MKELCRVIKYAIDTKDRGLKLRQEDTDDKWRIKAYSDADFTGDKETRISVTGYIIYFMNVPICWHSHGQKGVTLSTTEAEYVACSEVVKEILFILYLLRHMKIEVELPVHVNVDNIGAIFLAENQNSSDRTKHVDIRYHFIRQYIKEGTIMIEFVRSSENDSDIFTKNVTSNVQQTCKKMIWTKEEYEAEAETRILATGRVLRVIAYNSSTKGKCANNESEITENCEAEKWGSTNIHATAKNDDVSKENTEVEYDKIVSFDNVTEEDYF